LFDKIKSYFSDEKIEETDGLKISWENEWVHIRKSNTEPILRIISEAQTVDIANKLVDKIKALIN
jgi:phosphomannomutase